MKKSKDYAGIDCARLVFAFLIIAIHTSPLASFNETGDFILARVIARTGVPFFFMVSGFFLVTEYTCGNSRLISFIKKTVVIYIVAILIYIPVNIYNGYFSMDNLLPAIIKDIINTVQDTNKVIDNNNTIVNDSKEKLDDTVKIFKKILASSEEVINVTNLLKNELINIVDLKNHLLQAMKQVEDVSQKSVENTSQISSSIGEQAKGMNDILGVMENIKNGIDKLSDILNTNIQNNN